jgi:putative membrane protein
VALLSSSGALAHVSDDAGGPPHVATAFSDGPALPLLLLALAAYGIGLQRLWRSGAPRGATAGRAASFACGWCVLVLALVWPLDAFGEWLLSAHMAQHMLLAAVAAPLLIVGMARPVWVAALPRRWVRAAARSARRLRALRIWRTAAAPTAATVLQAVVMWAWHAPRAMEAALESDLVHYAMHASFLAAGWLFWSAMLRSRRDPEIGAAAGVLGIVATMMQMGLLGALLTFAAEPRYPHYLAHAPEAGLSALEDQQLAGLIMWVPAALPYCLGGVALAAAWLRRDERAGSAVSHRRHARRRRVAAARARERS